MGLALANMKRAPQVRDALGQAAQAKMPGLRAVLRHADAVVGYRDDDLKRIHAHGDVDARGLRVAQRVDESFLHDAVDRKRHARTELGG